ncbi:MAG: hypothetical protein ABSH06_32430 [Thermodesulfobacteriota bacterium]
MQKKLTITVDEEVYAGLHQIIGPRKISKFVQELVRPPKWQATKNGKRKPWSGQRPLLRT